MASEKRSVSCCGIHYPLARQFLTAARSSGLARSSSAGAVSQRGQPWLSLLAPGSRTCSVLITFLPHSPIALPSTNPVIRGTAAPVPGSAHSQPDFPRSTGHMRSCCIRLSSAHSPATPDTANRFRADVTEQRRSWRQSESINFMGTDYQTEERHYCTIQTEVYHPLLDIRQFVWERCHKYPREGRCSIQHK